ncbi:MAG: DUF934 domain-containing protein [Gammaproteobacteria bacterium]|jgi:uncharacterized protein (DUF934 family)|nr:DUF934 domain-containing protein [Gammaproteobacteria bacterium]|tara:strand:+ start:1778 stop:2278 length:501 start_codon:yes stop_codon:yes gene_type:complete
MQKLIKDGAIVNDRWTWLKEATNPAVLKMIPRKNLIVPLKLWRYEQEELFEFPGDISIWLNSHENVADIGEQLHELPLIALNFPVFSDGRPYSKARELRYDFGYKGELRAIGDVLRDQIFYMSRCGFDAFSPRYDQDVESCLEALEDFNTAYQASVAEPTPLFRRR